jgi:hypothetical protein
MGLKEIGIFLGLCIPFLLGTVWAVVDAAQKDFGSMGQKVLWLMIAAIPFVGFIFYLILGFRKGKMPEVG